MRINVAADLFYTSMVTVRSDATIKWYRKKLTPLVDYIGDKDTDDISLFHISQRPAGSPPYTLFDYGPFKVGSENILQFSAEAEDRS